MDTAMIAYTVGACLLGTFALYIGLPFLSSLLRKNALSKETEAKIKAAGAPEVVIVGGGVVGASLAAVLGRDGRKVLVIERDLSEPDRIVGELLQPGGLNALKTLGLAECVEEIDAITERGYVVLYKERRVVLPYPDKQVGVSFHHGRFVQRLRKAAAACPNVTMVEGTVINLVRENGTVIGVEYKDKASGETKIINSALTVVADGCFSKFRKELINSTVKVPSNFVALELHGCKLSQNQHAEVVLADPAPVLLYQIGSNDTRILIDVPGAKLPSNLNGELKEYMKTNIRNQLPEYVQPSFDDALENGRLRSMPNSFMPPSSTRAPGVLILGDAYNMRHPLTGGGMSVALNDIVIWRDLLRDVKDLSKHDEILARTAVFHWRRKSNHSFVVNVLAQALYGLFSAADDDLAALRFACFKYFELGGEAVEGPVNLLSVLKAKPLLLIGHFYAVALYAVFITFKSRPLLAFPVSAYKSARLLTAACRVLFPLLWSETRR
eukprot:Colp12_sorted_trinity150504_noHs@24128